MAILAGMKASAVDLTLPDRVSAHANSANTITATSFTDLPVPCSVAITNPHPTADMLVRVDYAAWIVTTTVACRVCPRISGSLTVAAGSIGTNAPSGYGQIIRAISSGAAQYEQFAAGYYAELPPGTATFTVAAYRESASTTVQVNFAVLDILPVRYLFT